PRVRLAAGGGGGSRPRHAGGGAHPLRTPPGTITSAGGLNQKTRAREQAEGLAPTPIIGLSADAMAHQVEALLAAGMDAHVAKPIDAARLYGVLEKVV
ncbi:MAG TPA: hypothetical protein PKA17_11135, partial [Phenylobacterium sp.]|nr:hypothetical protein [Phenylobacterium sp.]